MSFTLQHRGAGLFLLLATRLLTPAVSAQGETPSPAAGHRLQAHRLDQPIILDGRFDEPAWQRAAAATDFTQREPDPGAPASERTEIRVVYTERTLYIAIHAFDSDPEAIIAREMQRDGGLFRDDSVVVLLDTFDDDRNTYFFETNPLGARTDALVTDEGRDTNFEWDGVWDVMARRTADGWVAEMAIPFSTLRFDPQAEAWGLNVRRRIRHKNEEVFWAPIGLDADLFRVSLYGSLAGIEGVEPGLSLNVKPFVVASDTSSSTAGPSVETGSDFDAGLDVKWGVTRGLALDLTLNTDFAETEVDDQQVNLTRFSLFFPEKREFFLENSGIFEFGSDPGSGSPLLKVFFSRRIGIDDAGREQPIEGGMRLTGRAGAWNLGVLGVMTEAVESSGALSNASNETWAAVRLKRNVGQRSSVGLIVTNREGKGGDSNLVAGLDLDWKPTERLALAGFFARSDDGDLPSGDVASEERLGSVAPEGRPGGTWAAGAAIEWSGSIWGVEGGYVEIGEAFEPAMGFLRRRGVRRYNGEVEFEPRPDIPWLRNFNFEVEAEVFTLRDGTTESTEFQLEPLGIRFGSEDSLSLFVERNFERLFEPFEVTDGVVIPVGDYTFYDYGVRFDTNDGRRITADGSVRWSGFFDGDLFRAEATLGIRPNRFIRSQTTWEYNDVELPGGAFTATVLRERLSLAWNPRLRADTFLQYNDLDQLFAANLRFNWIYQPGADLFVVFNQTWDAPDLDQLDRRDRQVIVKFTYLWQR